MRVIVQRVNKASVNINSVSHSSINIGLLVLAAFEENDTLDELNWICSKIVNMRIFNDENESLNFDIKTINGEILVVSQFTLFASTKKGNRPSFLRSAKPGIALKLYEVFLKQLNELLPQKIKSGVFGADMKIDLVNDGPVTIIIDSKNKE